MPLGLAVMFATVVAQGDIWRTGYYPGWEQATMPASQLDFSALTHANPTNPSFLSYESSRVSQTKVSHARNRGLGGVMIWALGQDFTSGQPEPLLQAIQQALATPRDLTLQRTY